MRKNNRFAVAATVAAIMLSTMAAPAASIFAAETGTGVVTADVLNVRSEPTTSSSRLGFVYDGDKLTVLEHANGWYKVNFSGKTGYVAEGFLTVTGLTNPTTPPATAPSAQTGTVTADLLNVRSGASTAFGRIGTIANGKTVTILGSENGWYKISYDGKTGYVSGEFLAVTSAPSIPETPPEIPPAAPSELKVGVVTADVLNVRSGAGTSNSKVGVIYSGKQVTIESSSDGWHKISYDGTTGYVSAEFIAIKEAVTPPPTPPTPETPVENKVGIVTADVLNVRSGAGTEHGKIDTIFAGKSVTVVSSENGWHKISYDGKTGYVSAEYIDTTNLPSQNPPSNSANSAQAQALLDTARNELGYSTSDGFTKYGDWYGLPYTEWCGMFVSWCADQAGISTSVIPKHASCSAGVEWFKNNGTFREPSNYRPQAGDICYFTYGHVGIVESVSDTKVTLIEGNTTDSVRRRTYSLDHEFFWGYATPHYAN